jgi:hypothetical protein
MISCFGVLRNFVCEVFVDFFPCLFGTRSHCCNINAETILPGAAVDGNACDQSPTRTVVGSARDQSAVMGAMTVAP